MTDTETRKAAFTWFNPVVNSVENHLNNGGGSKRDDYTELLKRLTYIAKIRELLQPSPPVAAGDLSDAAMDAIKRIDKHTETYSGSYDDFYIVMRSIKAAQQPRQEWMDISTAPRDLTDIIVFRPNAQGSYIPHVGVDYYDKRHHHGDGAWMKSNKTTGPTHWLPLPEPPKETK